MVAEAPRPAKAARPPSDELQAARQLVVQGSLVEAIEQADRYAPEQSALLEDWLILKAQAELATGKYEQAIATVERGLKSLPTSIRLRWLGIPASRFNSSLDRAQQMEAEVGSLLQRHLWRYRDLPSQITIGRYLLHIGVDAKEVLDNVYSVAQEKYPAESIVYQSIGELALAKNDYQLAATNFEKAAELTESDPDVFLGLASAYQPSLPEKASEAVARALAINSRHVDTLLLVAQRQTAAEEFEAAAATLEVVFDVNPHHPAAWALRSFLYLMANEPEEAAKSRQRALQHWTQNPEVDYLIGKNLSRSYRFAEGSASQRQSLEFDANYLPAKMQLAHDLLRLGQEPEGWRLADEVFEADQYNVVANNLVALRDNLSEFAAIEHNGFVVRMERREAAAYGALVLKLLDEVNEALTAKYQTKLKKPIFIEIFPRQQDFAIRTFGVPGGSGFLGVCFGRVVTMNSPASPGSHMTNWRSVLWHEFCHVVTLHKTNNKMPRWLSEGISVYEERLANPAWGDSINPQYREMILEGQLTPVSQLSSAFLDPSSPLHLQFAYYQASLVVRFLVEEYGEQALLDVLEELGTGVAINDALARHTAPLETLDERFADYARQIADNLAPDADWEKPKSPITESSDWQVWLEKHPKSFVGLLAYAAALIKDQQYKQAHAVLDRLQAVYPDAKGAEQAYRLRAAASRALGNLTAETEAWESALRLDASDAEACRRLIEIYVAAADWQQVMRVSQRLQGINPMWRLPHRQLALAAEKTGDNALAIESLTALINLDPLDRAETYYRLASAQRRATDLEAAKRSVLLALESAPRYRDAHRLLLRVIEEGSGEIASVEDEDSPQIERDDLSTEQEP